MVDCYALQLLECLGKVLYVELHMYWNSFRESNIIIMSLW